MPDYQLKYTGEEVDEGIAKALSIYPIGSIYMSVNSTSPASIFGGTWEQIKDRFLLGAGSSYSNGATGGESAHTLTENELPTINGRIVIHGGENGSNYWQPSGVFSQSGTIQKYKEFSANTVEGVSSLSNIIFEVGGDAAHNNMPPYLAVYTWKRVA